MYQIIAKSKIWLSISGIAASISLIMLITFGLKLGIDFTGGSILQVKFAGQRPEQTAIKEELDSVSPLTSLSIQPAGDKEFVIRFQETDEGTHQKIMEKLRSADSKINQEDPRGVEEMRFDSIGPSVGQELKTIAVYAIFFAVIGIVAYIGWSFRQVSKPVASWKYGVAAVAALCHDVLIVLGLFAFLGKFYGVEVNSSFVAAVLTVFGYSVNDTIVVFDRIRENLPKSDKDFAGTVNDSINQTIGRSINTSATVILTLAAIYLFGGESIKYFALALIIGIASGTYSSIFIASPIVVWWQKLQVKKV